MLRTTKNIRCYLGIFNFYRRFIPRAAATLASFFLQWREKEDISDGDRKQNGPLRRWERVWCRRIRETKLALFADALLSDHSIEAKRCNSEARLGVFGFLLKKIEPSRIDVQRIRLRASCNISRCEIFTYGVWWRYTIGTQRRYIIIWIINHSSSLSAEAEKEYSASVGFRQFTTDIRRVWRQKHRSGCIVESRRSTVPYGLRGTCSIAARWWRI